MQKDYSRLNSDKTSSIDFEGDVFKDAETGSVSDITIANIRKIEIKRDFINYSSIHFSTDIGQFFMMEILLQVEALMTILILTNMAV